MYNIIIKQVKNGFLVNVSKSNSKIGPATSMEGMLGNIMGMVNQMEERDSKLHDLQNNSDNFGEHIFKSYKECVAFLSLLEDEISI